MSELPLFFCAGLEAGSREIQLDEETRRHVVTVLRMQPGEEIELTDGQGNSCNAFISLADKKKLLVSPQTLISHPPAERALWLGVSLLKNASRFEWMLEKVTEIGITRIIPLLTERTTRQHFRQDRMQQIVVSACLQSRQYHFPHLLSPYSLDQFLQAALPASKYIAHCLQGDKSLIPGTDQEAVLLIGPEGDFTATELSQAFEAGFKPVSLGQSRLRAETAGIVGAVLLRGNFL
jgi:16S rRNA (uracil1498-N3)-methyltransferase